MSSGKGKRERGGIQTRVCRHHQARMSCISTKPCDVTNGKEISLGNEMIVEDFDKIPKRFKMLMRDNKRHESKGDLRDEDGGSNKDDIWRIRIGETYCEFTSRIKKAGYTVPPGIPKTMRRGDLVKTCAAMSKVSRVHGEGSKSVVDFTAKIAVSPSNKVDRTKRLKLSDPSPSEDFGERSKKRRKQFMRSKSKVRIEESRQKRIEKDTERFKFIELRSLRDVVSAPPIIPQSWRNKALKLDAKMTKKSSSSQ